MNGFRYLVFIDDDNANHVYHEIIVQESGMCSNNQFFTSPIKALDTLRPLDLDKFPDIIFLDINMPEMTGWEFLDKLKEFMPEIPQRIVMLSSSSYHKDREKGKAHSMILDYIEKPLSEEDLKRLLGKI